MMRIKIIGFTSLIAILAVVAVAAGYRHGKNRNATLLDQGVGFTLRAKVTQYNPDGSVFGVTDDVRYESVDGSYRARQRQCVFHA